MAQHVLAKDMDRAGGRQEEPQKDRQGCRLAGAVAAEQRRGDTALDAKADAVDGDGRAVALDQILNQDDGLGHRPYMAHGSANGQDRPVGEFGGQSGDRHQPDRATRAARRL